MHFWNTPCAQTAVASVYIYPQSMMVCGSHGPWTFSFYFHFNLNFIRNLTKKLKCENYASKIAQMLLKNYSYNLKSCSKKLKSHFAKNIKRGFHFRFASSKLYVISCSTIWTACISNQLPEKKYANFNISTIVSQKLYVDKDNRRSV